MKAIKNQLSRKLTLFLILFSALYVGAFAQSGVQNFAWNSGDANSVTVTNLSPGPGFNLAFIISINTENSFAARATGSPAPSGGNLVYAGSGEQVVWVGIGNQTTPNATITGLNPNTTYYINVISYVNQPGTSIPVYSSNFIKPVVTCGTSPAAITDIVFAPTPNSIAVSSMTPIEHDFTNYLVKVNTVNSFTSPAAIESSLPSANSVYSGSGEQVVYVGGSSAPGLNVTNLGGANAQQYFFKVFRYNSNCTTGDFHFETSGYTTSTYTCAPPPAGTNQSLFVSGGSINAFELSPGYSRTGTIPNSGLLIYINDVNSFTDPATSIEGIPTMDNVYSGSGQQLISLGNYGTIFTSEFAPVTGLKPNTTYYFKSYSFVPCGGTTYVNTSDTRTLTLTTCDFSDNLSTQPVFGAVTDNTMELASFTGPSSTAPASAPDGYVIRMSDANSFSSIVNGTAVPTGDPAYAGAGEQVIYAGNSTTPNLNITGLSANTTYYFNIVAYYPACGVPSQIRYQQEGYSFSKSNSGVQVPVITFNDIYKSVGDANFNLSATSSDGGTVTYQIISQTSLGTSLSGANNETVTIGGIGTITIEASANGATAQATLTITDLATNGTYFMDKDGLVFLENGVATTFASLNGGIYGTTGVGFAVIDDAIWFATGTGGANNAGVLTRRSLDGSTETTFDFPSTSVANTFCAISKAGGKVWVTRNTGGIGVGDVFVSELDGTGTTQVHSFGADINSPFTEIVEVGGVFYGACSSDAAFSFSGGIFSLTSDGMGGYTYAVEHSFTNTDNNRGPLYGFTVHDGLIWYSSSVNRFVAYDPSTNTFPHSFDMGEVVYKSIVINNELYVMGSQNLYRIYSNYSGYVGEGLLTGGFINWEDLTYDGTFIYGIGIQTGTTTGAVWKMKPDGTGFENLYTNPTADQQFISKAINFNAKVTTGVSFPDQTVPHARLVTLDAQTNSTGAITYELINDMTSSTLIGNQLTPGNIGTVTVRVNVAEDPNFNAITKDATFTIVKSDPIFTINDIVLPYGSGGQGFNPTTNNYPFPIVYQFVDGGSLVTTGPNTGTIISGNIINPINPGTETVRATLAETANFNGLTVDFQYTLEKRILNAVNIILTPPASLDYDATPKEYTAALNISVSPFFPPSDFEFTYEGRNGTVYPSSTTAPTDAGDYTVTASVKDSNPNYQGSSNPVDFTIAPVATSIDLNLPVTNPIYTGSGIAINPFANDVMGNPTVNLTTEYSEQGVGSFSETLPINVGTYDVRVNIAASEVSYLAPEVTGSFTIDQAPQTITFNPIPDVECGQTTIDLSLYATSSTGSTLSFASDNLSVATISGSTATIVGAGTAVITASQAGDANVEPALDQVQTLTIAAVQENFSVDNPANVQVCDGGPYILPALTTGNYFSEPGGAGVPYNAGDPIATNSTIYVYGVSGVNAACTDENSFTVTIENLAIDQPSDITAPISYTLPALTNGNYFTGTGGSGTALNAGDVISSTQTLYVYRTDAMTGCSREVSFTVTVIPNPALHFEQVTNLNDYDYLSVNDNNTLDFTTDFTFEVWVNFDQLSVTTAGYGWRCLMAKSRYTDSYGLMVYAGDKTMRFYHAGFGSGSTDYTWSSLTAGAWHHVAVKLDGTNNKASILIDGTEVASTVDGGSGTLTPNSEPLLIGAGDVRSNDPYPFDGAMDEVRFWNVARSDAEIIANKDVELEGTESGLVLYYNFSEGTINGDNTGLTEVTDRSVNTNNATFNRFALTGNVSNYVDGASNGVSPGLPQSITFDPLANATFGDVDFNLTATASSGLGVTYSSSNTSVATVSGNTVTIVGAGSTTITASQSGDAAYLPAASVGQLLTVDPFSTSISLNLPGSNPTYTGLAQSISPTANDASSNPTLSVVTEYSVSGAGSYSTTAPTNAGTYDVRVNLAGSETNYSATQATGSFTIDKAPLTARLDDASIVYGVIGRNNHPATYTGFVNGETESVLSITTGSPTVLFLDIPGGGINYNVGGPYAGGITWASANPETLITSNNYVLTFQPGDITSVTPRPINVTANARAIAYGDDANAGNAATFEPYDEAGERGLANGETAASFAGSATFQNITEVNVGVYPGAIIPNGGLTNSNYTINFVTGELTIGQKDLNITADNRTITYGDDANVGNTVSYSGFISGENETVLGGTLSFENISQSNVGTYTEAISPEGLTSTNYNILYNLGDLTIDPKALTVTADNRTISYGDDANAGNTVTYTGFISGENETNLGGTLAFANISQTVVGSYSGVITPSGLTSSNYSIGFVSGDLTIGQKALTVTADNRTITYGDDANSGNTVSYSGFITGENEANLGGTLSFANISQTDAGTYNGVITPSGLTSSNYAINFIGGDLTIGQKALTITADNRTLTYGDDANTGNTVSYSGFITGENEANLSGTLSFANIGQTDAGTYNGVITPSGLTNANYAINFVSGDLTIGQKALTITADNRILTYGDDANVGNTVSYSGFISGENETNLGGTLSFANISQTDVGTYNGVITPSGLTSSNYAISFVSGDLTIGQNVLTITADNRTITYGDDANVGNTVSYSGFITGENEMDLGGTLSFANISQTNAGTYNGVITPSGLTSSNYTINFVSGDLTIGQKALTVTADNRTITYGDDANTGNTVSYSGFITSENEANLGGTLSFANISQTDAGTYNGVITPSGLTNANYAINFVSGDLTIGQKALTVTADNRTITYGDDANTGNTVSYSGFITGENETNLGGTLSFTNISQTDVGSYSGVITPLGFTSGNYAISFVSGDLTIGQKALTVTADNRTITYGDDANTGNTVSYSGFISGENETNLGGTLSFANISQTNVGSYNGVIIPSGLTSGNYAISFVSGDLTIANRAITVTADAQTKTYADADPTLTYQVTSGMLQGADVFSGALTRVAGENVGTYAIQQGTLDNSNYTITFVSNDLTVEARALTVTADANSKTYGDADPGFTYQITSGALQGSDVISGSLSRVTGENVGTYAIQQGSLTAGGNYDVTYVPADLTINQKSIVVAANVQSKVYGDADPVLTYGHTPLAFSDTFTGSLERAAGETPGTYVINQGTLALNGNYQITFIQANLIIVIRSITVTADPQNKTYGDVDPAFTYQVTSGALQGSDVLSGALSRVAGEDVGTYAIQLGTLDNANYDITFVSDNLTIGTRALTVTADAKSKTYGAVDPALTYQITNGMLQGSDMLSGALSRDAGEDAGTYAINQGTVDAGSNYDITYVSDNLTIDPLGIEITADAATKTYGDSDPSFTYQITNGSLLGGDSFTGSISRVVGEDVGTYALTQGTVTAGANYNVTFVSADLTVTKADLTISAQNATSTYGSNPTVSTNLMYTGFLNGDDETVLDVLPMVSTSATAVSPVGSYAATLSGGSDNNYNYMLQNGTLNVVAKDLTITASNNTITYGGDPNTGNSVSYAGFVNGENESVLIGSLTFDNISQTDAGFYAGAIVPSGLTGSNYAVTFVNGDLTIDPISLTITIDAKSKTYGGMDPAFTYMLTSGSLLGGDAFTGSLSRVAGEDVGTYVIGQGTLTAGANYAENIVTADLTITKADLTISAQNATSTYGSNPTVNTNLVYSGFVNGDDASVLDALPMVSTSATATSAVGNYAATLSGGSDNNYNFILQDGVLEVTPASLTITADDKNSTYGDTSFPALSVSYAGFVNGENENVLTTATAISTTAVGSDAGNYPITVSGAVAPNYSITNVDGTLTIGKAQLTITADDKVMNEGDVVPALTLMGTGFVNGEDISVIDALPTASTAASSSSLPGTYPITLNGGSDNNYALTLVDGTLTISDVLGLNDDYVELQVYPNPTPDVIFIDLTGFDGSEVNVSIYDMQGRLKYNKQVVKSQLKIDLGGFSSGQYLIKVKNEDHEITERVILSK